MDPNLETHTIDKTKILKNLYLNTRILVTGPRNNEESGLSVTISLLKLLNSSALKTETCKHRFGSTKFTSEKKRNPNTELP